MNLLVAFIISWLCPAAFAEAASPVEKLKGEWIFQPEGRQSGNILFLDGGRFYHGHTGEGDLRFLGGNRFEITYYTESFAGPAGRTCVVLMNGNVRGEIVVNNISRDQGCFWGTLTRRAPIKSVEGQKGFRFITDMIRGASVPVRNPKTEPLSESSALR